MSILQNTEPCITMSVVGLMVVLCIIYGLKLTVMKLRQNVYRDIFSKSHCSTLVLTLLYGRHLVVNWLVFTIYDRYDSIKLMAAEMFQTSGPLVTGFGDRSFLLLRDHACGTVYPLVCDRPPAMDSSGDVLKSHLFRVF